jgi:proline iminopeptidase
MVTRRPWFVGATLRAFAFSVFTFAMFTVGCGDTGDLEGLVPPTAERDPKLPQIKLEVSGRTRSIHAEALGEPASPTILFLHGSLSDYRALRIFRSLADRYQLVFWDQRGNGLSERITESEYDRDSIVEEIDRVRRHYAGDRAATLVGHSFGAMYAALYASTYPERVDQMVLIEPGGLNSQIFNDTFEDIINISLFDLGMNEMFWQNELLSPSSHEALDLRGLMVLLNGRQTRYHCDPEHPPHLPVWRPGGYVEYLRSKVLGGSGGFAAPSFDFDFARGLDAFPQKVLFVAGSCGALGPDYQERHHLPLFQDAELVTIPNTGHRLIVEAPDAVLDAVRGYLDAYGD